MNTRRYGLSSVVLSLSYRTFDLNDKVENVILNYWGHDLSVE